MATASKSEAAKVLLYPNADGKGNWALFKDSVLLSRNYETREVQQALSCLETGRPYDVPLPIRDDIVRDNTQPPAMFGNPPSAAQPPDDATVSALMTSAFVERQKILSRVKAAGTAAFHFLEAHLSHESKVLVREHAEYAPANEVEPKNPVTLWRIIKATHMTGGAGGLPMTSAEKERLQVAWANFHMNHTVSIGDFHLQFTQWIERRVAAGLPEMSVSDQVTAFYAKLDPGRYAALSADMENDEQKELLAGRQVAHGTLAQALARVRGWKDPNVKPAAGKRVSVFTLADDDGTTRDSNGDVARACEALAAAIPELAGTDPTTVLMALKNAVQKKGSGKGSSASAGVAAPLMVNGRPWTRPCSEPGCSGIHPFFMHQQITGKPLGPANQQKVDAYAARQKAKTNNADKATVAVARSDDESDDDDVARYFITYVAPIANPDRAAEGGDRSDDELYAPERYTTLMSFADGTSPFDDHHLLFDNQAGSSMIKTPGFLAELQPLRRKRIISGIAGEGGGAVVAESSGVTPLLPGLRVPYAPGATANVLAECDCVAMGWSVRRVAEPRAAYHVVTPTHTLVFELMPGWKAHYACRLSAPEDLHTTDTDATRAALVATVKQNLAQYTAAERNAAIKARKLQVNLGLPCSQYLINGLHGIQNAGVSPQDVRRAEAIGGKPEAKVRGGTHERPLPTVAVELANRKDMAPAWMEVDIMFAHGLAFLVAVLLPLNHVMGCYLKHRTVAEIGSALTSFVAAAYARMYDVGLIRCDGEKAIAAYTTDLERDGVKLSSEPGVHAPHVERTIQTIKDYVRGQENGGCVVRMGRTMLIMAVLFKISRLNLLPTKASLDGYGSFVHFEGRPVSAETDLRWAFGDWAEATKPGKTLNDTSVSRTEGCVMGIPSMNRSGSVTMYKLSTGTMVSRAQFQVRPWPDYAVEHMNDLADEDRIKSGDEWIGDDAWEPVVEDGEDDARELPAAVQVPPQPQPAAEAGVVAPAAAARVEVQHPALAPVDVHIEPEVQHPAPAPVNVPIGAQNIDGQLNMEAPIVEGAVVGPQQEELQPQQQPQRQPPALRRRLANRTDSLGSVLQARLTEAEDHAALRRQLLLRANWHDKEYCFKISVRAALRERGPAAEQAILSEMQQMLDRRVWHGVRKRDLTSDQVRKVLRIVTFLKDKYTAQNIFDKFKARLCADGSTQDHDQYENVSSPTATTTSTMMVAAIAAAEGRKVITADVSGAFLHADMAMTGVVVHVRLDSIMTRFLVKLDPSYAQYVNEDGTCIVQLDRALYGTIEAARLWYMNISSKLKEYGFEANPYDECVFNKVGSDGHQITIVLYVDDMMITCESEMELDRFEAYLHQCYGVDSITKHTGDVIDFLGMTFDFRIKGEVRVTMERLVAEIIAGAGVVAERKTPATETLFEVRIAPKLDPAKRDYFRSYVAKLLYVSKRVRPEMLAAVSFLSTRATEPDIDDLAKLHRVLGYLLGTRERGVVLHIGDTMTVSAFVDAAYGVHTGSGKSHSGCAIVLGNNGPVHVKSTKQKLVTKSSTEAELVALSDYASQAIWARNLVAAQGYDVGPVVLHQDNMSCMALMKRGGPASERTRHIDIRYFWVKERVDGKDAVIRHLSTEKMHVNVMTKPVQGQQFISERNALTNWY